MQTARAWLSGGGATKRFGATAIYLRAQSSRPPKNEQNQQNSDEGNLRSVSAWVNMGTASWARYCFTATSGDSAWSKVRSCVT
jgi:hypothetical protein